MSYNINPPTKKTNVPFGNGTTCKKCSNPADSEKGSLLCRDHDRIEASQMRGDFAIPQPTDARENQKPRPGFTAESSEHNMKRPYCSMNGCEAPSSSASFPCLCPFHFDYFSRPTTEELGIFYCQYPNCTFFWTEKKLLPQGTKLFCEWHVPEEPVYDPPNPQSRPPASHEHCKACTGPVYLLPTSGGELCGSCWRIDFGSDPKKGSTASSLGQDHHQSQQQPTPGKNHELAPFEDTPRSFSQLPQKAAQVQQQQQPHFSRDRTTIPPNTHQLPRLQEQLQNPSSQPPNDDGSQHYGEKHQALVAQPPQRGHLKKTYGQNGLQRLPEGHPRQSKEMQKKRGRQLHSTVPSKETHGQNVQKDHQQSPLAGFHGYFGQQQQRNGSDEATGKQQTRQPSPRNAEKLEREKGERLHRNLLLKKPQQELSHLSQEQAQEEEDEMDQVQHDAEQMSPAEKHAIFWDDYPACKCEGRLLVADTWQNEKHWPQCPLNLSSRPPHSEKTRSIWDQRKRWKTWARRKSHYMENPGVQFCSGAMREQCLEPLDPKSPYKICDECRKIYQEREKRRKERKKKNLGDKEWENHHSVEYLPAFDDDDLVVGQGAQESAAASRAREQASASGAWEGAGAANMAAGGRGGLDWNFGSAAEESAGLDATGQTQE